MSYYGRFLILPLFLLVPSVSLAAPEDNQEITGQLTADDPKDPARQQPAKIHELKLSKGKLYQIDLTSKDFDSYLRLVDSTGKEVASDDDSGGELNSRIKYTPTQDDSFKIYVTTFAGGQGAYVLKIKGSGDAVAKDGGKEEMLINANDNLAQTDNPDPRQRPAKLYEVKFKKGRDYQIDLKSDAFDAYLTLADGKNDVIAQNDDFGGTLNSRIVFKAVQDGAFKIYASSLGGDGVGAYTLTVKALGAAAGGGGGKLKTPTAGNPTRHQDQLTPNDPPDNVRQRPAKSYSVEMKGGKTYVINLTSVWDNYLRLEGPNGQQLAADDDSGGQLNARITFMCPADGVYRVIATAFGGGTGDFSLQIEEE